MLLWESKKYSREPLQHDSIYHDIKQGTARDRGKT